MKTPYVSVLLPVFNAEKTIGESVQSILNQTWTDFELIIIDDGSFDNTAHVLDQFSDPRIRRIYQQNVGLPITLNRSIKVARGKFLARQDADDISLPLRLEKQVHFLERHPEYGLIGTWTQILENELLSTRMHCHPTSNGEIQIRLLFNNYFVHSSVMFRKSVIDITGGYSEKPEDFPPEDYELWLRMAHRCKVANLADPLIQYRELPNSISRSKLNLIHTRAQNMARLNLQRVLPNPMQWPQLELLIAILNNGKLPLTFKEVRILFGVLRQIRMQYLSFYPEDGVGIRVGFRYCCYSLFKAYLKQLSFGS